VVSRCSPPSHFIALFFFQRSCVFDRALFHSCHELPPPPVLAAFPPCWDVPFDLLPPFRIASGSGNRCRPPPTHLRGGTPPPQTTLFFLPCTSKTLFPRHRLGSFGEGRLPLFIPTSFFKLDFVPCRNGFSNGARFMVNGNAFPQLIIQLLYEMKRAAYFF